MYNDVVFCAYFIDKILQNASLTSYVKKKFADEHAFKPPDCVPAHQKGPSYAPVFLVFVLFVVFFNMVLKIG